MAEEGPVQISAVRAAQPYADRAPKDWRGWLGQVLVSVEAEDGLVGYGMGAGGPAGIEVIQTALRSLLTGQDATDVEGLWERMYRATLSYGQKGLALMAISGVDLALWDLRGKREGKSLVEVLGGEPGVSMPAYRTTGIDGVKVAVEEGFTAVKLAGIGQYDPVEQLTELTELAASARRAAGDEVALMTDAAMGWDDPALALAAAEGLAEYGLGWLEEPLQADDVEGYAWLCERSPIPIAGGEHEYTARGFQQLMERRAHKVFQPDVTWCGGLTELVKIYELARQHGVRVCPHRGSEVWSVHAIAALDPEPLPESGRPWMDWVGGPQIAGGRVEVGSAPGFGLELDPALLG